MDNDIEKELEGHWGREEILWLLEKGIIKGNGSSLKLADSVSRAEFATMILRALERPLHEYNGGFSDVSFDDWYAKEIQTASDIGIMQGSNSLMRPEDPITREEMAKMIVLAYDFSKGAKEETEKAIAFPDEAKISAWAKEYVSRAVALGLMQGFETSEFRPSEYAKREQAMLLIYRILNSQKENS